MSEKAEWEYAGHQACCAEIDRLTFLHKQDHALADRYQEHREAAEREVERLRGDWQLAVKIAESNAIEMSRLQVSLQAEHDSVVDMDHALDLRDREIDRLRATQYALVAGQESYMLEIREKDREIERLKADLDSWRALGQERNHYAREVERLKASIVDDAGPVIIGLGKEIERLRAALEEMLESFTEPEDDNDILRRARAAISGPKTE